MSIFRGVFQNKKILLVYIVIIIAVMSAPFFIQCYWASNIPEEFHFTGFLQSDQITYTAIFRSVIERGNGFSYSYPYAAPSAENPKIHFQLPFTMLSWLWKISGSLILPWEVMRYFFGILFFLALVVFIDAIFENVWKGEGESHEKIVYRLLVFLILVLGGGMAWMFTSIKYFLSNPDSLSFLELFSSVEGTYHWWFLNIFRNVFYPLEMLYHFFFIIAMLGVVNKSKPLIFIGQAGACISGVFVGIEVSAILIVYYLIECLIQCHKDNLKNLLISLSIFLVFFVYYAVFIQTSSIGQNLVEQHKQNIHEIIPIWEYIPSYGILLLMSPLVFLNKDFRRRILESHAGRLMVVWGVVVLLLIQNDKLLGSKSVQPPHFTRGYLFSFFVLISSLGLYQVRKKFKSVSKLFKFFSCLIIVAVFIPDNILFIAERFSSPPHYNVLTFEKERWSLFEFLNTLNRQSTVFTSDRKLGDQIPAFTHHASILGQIYSTPYNEQKSEMAEDFFKNKNVDLFIKKFDIDLIILPIINTRQYEQTVYLPEMQAIYSNKVWKVYKVDKTE